MDSECYGLLQVMGYHSMSYLRFDCSVSCYYYYHLGQLSLDKIISNWNKLTVSVNKKAVNICELKEKVKEFKVDLKKRNEK